MARRADHSHLELSDLILSAATQIVEMEGHRALTARRISERIGYSVGTLYNHFENIDDVIWHINAQTLSGLTQNLENVVLSGDPHKDTIAYLRCYLSCLAAQPQLWRMIFEHTLPNNQKPPAWYLKQADHVLSICEQALMPLYGGPCQHSQNATRILWAGLHGITSLYASGKLANVSSLSVEEMADNLVTNFIRGIEETSK